MNTGSSLFFQSSWDDLVSNITVLSIPISFRLQVNGVAFQFTLCTRMYFRILGTERYGFEWERDLQYSFFIIFMRSADSHFRVR